MPGDVAAFADETGFERIVLDRAMPLLPVSEARSVIDLRGGAVGVSVTPATVHAYAGDSTSRIDLTVLRPLFFGAAWKVLDLLVELALGGISPPIEDKTRMAAQDIVPAIAPFYGQQQLWTRLMRTYATTKILRHSFVHRRFKVDETTGLLEGTPRGNEPMPHPMTADEQLSFGQAAQGTAEAVIAGKLSRRQRDQFSWVLDQLGGHHGQPPLGGSPVHGVIPTVLVDAELLPSGELRVDPVAILNGARQGVLDRDYFDLRVYLEDSRILAGTLEDAPKHPVILGIDNPPNWLQWM